MPLFKKPHAKRAKKEKRKQRVGGLRGDRKKASVEAKHGEDAAQKTKENYW